MIINQKIKERKIALESIRERLSRPSSSFCKLDLGVTTEREKEIMERSCDIEPLEKFSDALARRQTEQSLSVGALKKRYYEVRSECGNQDCNRQDIPIDPEDFDFLGAHVCGRSGWVSARLEVLLMLAAILPSLASAAHRGGSRARCTACLKLQLAFACAALQAARFLVGEGAVS